MEAMETDVWRTNVSICLVNSVAELELAAHALCYAKTTCIKGLDRGHHSLYFHLQIMNTHFS